MFEVLLTFTCWNYDHWIEVKCGEIATEQAINYQCDHDIFFGDINGEKICFIGE